MFFKYLFIVLKNTGRSSFVELQSPESMCRHTAPLHRVDTLLCIYIQSKYKMGYCIVYTSQHSIRLDETSLFSYSVLHLGIFHLAIIRVTFSGVPLLRWQQHDQEERKKDTLHPSRPIIQLVVSLAAARLVYESLSFHIDCLRSRLFPSAFLHFIGLVNQHADRRRRQSTARAIRGHYPIWARHFNSLFLKSIKIERDHEMTRIKAWKVKNVRPIG